jgi:hypothetical protein
MIDDGHAPRHQHVVADHNAPVAGEIGKTNEAAVADLNLSASILKSDIRMDDGPVSNAQPVAGRAAHAAPAERGAVANGNGTRSPASPAENDVDHPDKRLHELPAPQSIAMSLSQIAIALQVVVEGQVLVSR